MNWQIFGLALLFGLLAFPVMTKQSSMAHKYAVVATQIVAGYFLALYVPERQTVLVGVSVGCKHLADILACGIAFSVDKVLVMVEVWRVKRHARSV